jgi:exodeoxyribonuclease-3
MSSGGGQLALIPAGDHSGYKHQLGCLRVLTWNVQHASAVRSLRQAAWIAAQSADVAVLTEVAAADGGHALAQALTEHGFTVSSPPGSGDYRTMIASRSGKHEPCPEISASHLPHRFVAIRLHFADGTMAAVAGLYVPSRGNRQRRNVDKRAFQNAVSMLLPGLAGALAVDGPIVIAGDLNVVEPGHHPHHAVFGAWEYDFYDAFGESGYSDAFRHLHPGQVDHSWFGRRSGNGYRFDHIFCSPLEGIVDCRYIHEVRLAGLSDHSAMTAAIAVSDPVPSPSAGPHAADSRHVSCHAGPSGHSARRAASTHFP